MNKFTPKQKEEIIKGARISQAQPTTFWKDVEQRMNIREKAKLDKVQPRRVKPE